MSEGETAPGTRLEIGFFGRGATIDRTLEMLPGEDLDRFRQRCLDEVTEYFRFDWSNRYRLRGEIETDWLSESAMYDLLRKAADA